MLKKLFPRKARPEPLEEGDYVLFSGNSFLKGREGTIESFDGNKSLILIWTPKGVRFYAEEEKNLKRIKSYPTDALPLPLYREDDYVLAQGFLGKIAERGYSGNEGWAYNVSVSYSPSLLVQIKESEGNLKKLKVF